MNDLNIVLLEPEIPQNTGNIARTCAATGASLHMIKPFGFKIDDSKLKRAGMDYWYSLDIHYYENLEDFFEKNPNCNFYLFTKKASKCYTDVVYPEKVFFFFGKESLGLPEDFIMNNYEKSIRIPMKEGLRSLNQSNSCAIAVYEYLRQHNFENLCFDTRYFNKES